MPGRHRLSGCLHAPYPSRAPVLPSSPRKPWTVSHIPRPRITPRRYGLFASAFAFSWVHLSACVLRDLFSLAALHTLPDSGTLSPGNLTRARFFLPRACISLLACLAMAYWPHARGRRINCGEDKERGGRVDFGYNIIRIGAFTVSRIGAFTVSSS
jgi:hypothetical protein